MLYLIPINGSRRHLCPRREEKRRQSKTVTTVISGKNQLGPSALYRTSRIMPPPCPWATNCSHAKAGYHQRKGMGHALRHYFKSQQNGSYSIGHTLTPRKSTKYPFYSDFKYSIIVVSLIQSIGKRNSARDETLPGCSAQSSCPPSQWKNAP